MGWRWGWDWGVGAGWYRCCQAIAAGMMPKRERMPKAPVVLGLGLGFGLARVRSRVRARSVLRGR